MIRVLVENDCKLFFVVFILLSVMMYSCEDIKEKIPLSNNSDIDPCHKN